jgi:hypothetical protein
MPQRHRVGILLLALLGILGPVTLEAQVRRGRAVDTRPPWAPITVGVRAGYDQNANGEVLGADVRLPLLRNGVLELVPSAEVIFDSRAKEQQYSLELVYVVGGRTGGPFFGGGAGYRTTVFGTSPEEPRNTLFGYSVVAGARSQFGPLQTQLQLRWIFLDEITLRPLPITLGLSLPLWGSPPAS